MDAPFDVVVIGGGAAGLFCALHAGRRGRRVLVLEHSEAVGRKILISGGGRCNFTNTGTKAENFLSENPHFAKSALARYRPADFIALVEKHGIAWHEKKLGQLFCDGPAVQIVRMLVDECRASGVEIRTGVTVESVTAGFVLATSAGEMRCASLVLATGGPSIPKMGATGFAYSLAAEFGLRVVKPRPGLVPLTLDGPELAHWGPLSGVSTPVRVTVGKRSFEENLLFTHRGLSGPAILQISSYWTSGSMVLNLTPGRDLVGKLMAVKQAKSRATPRAVLAEFLSDRLATRWLEKHPLDRAVYQTSDAALRALAEGLSRWVVTPAGTEGFDKAEVTVGGIDTAELSSQTMESVRVPGLYCIGECVDVTGWLGGYNFQWAWASGFAAGAAV